MGKPDVLSRRSNHPQGKDDNANVTLLPSNMFKVHNTEATLVDSGGDELVEHIQRSTDYDDAVVKALQELRAGTLQSNKWEKDRDLVLYRGCVYIPKDPQLCHDIVCAHHNSMVTSHPGQWKMLELVSWLDSTLVSVLVKITPRRKYLTPKISVGALMGAQFQLAGIDN